MQKPLTGYTAFNLGYRTDREIADMQTWLKNNCQDSYAWRWEPGKPWRQLHLKAEHDIILFTLKWL